MRSIWFWIWTSGECGTKKTFEQLGEVAQGSSRRRSISLVRRATHSSRKTVRDEWARKGPLARFGSKVGMYGIGTGAEGV
jgi:hypothetical protein